MVAANELRIGNWVLRSGHTVQVAGISNEGILLEYGDTFRFEYIQPIPLTPEILEKAGFIYETIPDEVGEEGDIIGGYSQWRKGNFCFTFQNGLMISSIKPIAYLHLFQNWYFFETAEELKIEL